MTPCVEEACCDDRTGETIAGDRMIKLQDLLARLDLDIRELKSRLQWVSLPEFSPGDMKNLVEVATTNSSALVDELDCRIDDVVRLRDMVTDMIDRLTV